MDIESQDQGGNQGGGCYQDPILTLRNSSWGGGYQRDGLGRQGYASRVGSATSAFSDSNAASPGAGVDIDPITSSLAAPTPR